MKCSKILLAFLIAAAMLFITGCQDQYIEGQVVRGGYTWLRSGSELTDDGLRFSVDELSHLVIDTIHNSVTIGTHNGSDILIEYIPDTPGSGRYYHHVIRPRYEFSGDHLEIFRDVSLQSNTFIRSGSINILVPVYDGQLLDSVSISTTLGDVRAGNFNANSIRINTRNRDVRLTNVNANTAIVNTSLGGIVVINVDIENNLTLQTESRSIDISNARIGGILSATTSREDITITNVETNFDNANLSTSENSNIIIN